MQIHTPTWELLFRPLRRLEPEFLSFRWWWFSPFSDLILAPPPNFFRLDSLMVQFSTFNYTCPNCNTCKSYLSEYLPLRIHKSAGIVLQYLFSSQTNSKTSADCLSVAVQQKIKVLVSKQIFYNHFPFWIWLYLLYKNIQNNKIMLLYFSNAF